jgi:hypothetical protein
MRHAPFRDNDLRELNRLYQKATAVVAMDAVADGLSDPEMIAVRHDVDNHIEPAAAMAVWEREEGIRSTYYILHTAPYWQDKPRLRYYVEEIASDGHEIGFHLNAITAAIETGRDPLDILREDLDELRSFGYPVRSVVAHGDNACYQYGYINDELFTESARPEFGEPDRWIGGKFQLAPVSREIFGFDYDPNWLPRGMYLSDSGGKWSTRFETVADAFPFEGGMLHMLVHPDWWAESFTTPRLTAYGRAPA